MLLVSCNGVDKVQVQTRGPAMAKLLLLNCGTTHMSVHQLIADVDRLQPPTDSRWRGTAQCETV